LDDIGIFKINVSKDATIDNLNYNLRKEYIICKDTIIIDDEMGI
jgi:hypothetical protein